MFNHMVEQRLDATFHALADPTRRGMLANLARGEKSIGALAEPFAMSFAGAAKHVKVLEGAGLVARRIVAFVKPGDMVVAGQRVGLIRFGSRVDIFLPEEYGAQVVLGQRTIAGETIIARRGLQNVAGVAQ